MEAFTRFLGIVEPQPVTGRWVWPFVQMEVGDWFLVRQSQREPEKLRNMTMVRGSQLMKRFGFTKHDPEHPGMCKVWRKPNWEPSAMRSEFDYQGLRALLDEQYGMDADGLPWSRCMEPGDSCVVPAKRNRPEEDGRIAVRVEVAGDPFVVELGEGAISITRIEEDETLQDWVDRQVEAIMS